MSKINSLDEAIKEQSEKLKWALSKQIKKDDKYTGVAWCWSSDLEKYISSKESYIICKVSREPLFKTKDDARKYRSARRELNRLISIKIQKEIEQSLIDTEKIVDTSFVDYWRNRHWYGREW